MKTGDAIRVILVDDHFMVRRGLAAALHTERDIKVVAEAANSDELMERYRKHRPDIVMMDWRLPGLNGGETTALLRQEFPEAKVLMLSALDGDDYVQSAIHAGASGYLLKSSDRPEILEAIRKVHAGGEHFSPEITAVLDKVANRMAITAREREVLAKVAAGESNKEIGDQLGIAEATVKVFMGRIFAKLDARDRAHAVFLAIKRGIIDPL